MTTSRKTIYENLIIIVLFIFVILIGVFQNNDFDFWYHLKSGEVIVTQGLFPKNDPFYYSLDHLPFGTDYWLFQVILYGVYKISGFNGITIFHALFFVATIFLLYKIARLKTESLLIIVPVIVIVSLEVRRRFFPRPDIFALLFFVLYLLFINLYLEKKKNYLYFIPVVQLLWANSHLSFIFGLIILFSYLAGTLVNNVIMHLKNRSGVSVIDSAVRQFIYIFVISFISSIINPDFIGIFKKLFMYQMATKNELLLQSIQELHGYNLAHDIYSIFSFILLFTAFTFLLRIRKLQFSELFIFVIFAYFCLSAIRFIAPFMLIVGLVLFSNLEYIRISYLKRITKYYLKIYWLEYAFELLFIIYVGFHFAPNRDFPFGVGIAQSRFPVKLVDFIQSNNVTGKMLNPFHYGGYLEWRLYPQQKVFIDGRIAGNTDFRNNYYLLHYDERKWIDAKNRYRFDYVIVQYPSFDPDDQLAIYLGRDSDYKIAYFDDQNILFIRQAFALDGYYYISPFKGVMDRLMPGMNSNQEVREKTKKELLRALSFNPDMAQLHLYLGIVYFYEKDYTNALAENKKVLILDPSFTGVHHNIGLIYFNQDEYENAIKEFMIELDKNPSLIQTRFILAISYLRLGNSKLASEQCAAILKIDPANQKAKEMLKAINDSEPPQ